jgi:hypothetical protein
MRPLARVFLPSAEPRLDTLFQWLFCLVDARFLNEFE